MVFFELAPRAAVLRLVPLQPLPRPSPGRRSAGTAAAVVTSPLNRRHAPSHAVPRRAYATATHISNIAKGKVYEADDIRNIGISAHIDSGKTTLTERLLFYSGRIDEIHEVKGKDGVGATMDFMELERQRGITIQSAAIYVDWKGVNVNIIDTPGHVDFTVEVERALRVLDGAVLVLCAVGGVQSQTLTVNRQMRRYGVPCVAFVNKIDRTGADPMRVAGHVRTKLGHNCAPIQMPVGLGAETKGVIDLIEEKAAFFEDPMGTVIREEEIPVEHRAEAAERREELIAAIGNADDQIAEMFLNEKTPSASQLHDAIRRTCIARSFTPIMLGSALKNKGVQHLLDAIVRYLPKPHEVSHFALDETNPENVKRVPLSNARTRDAPFLGLAFKLEQGRYGQLTYIRVYQGILDKGASVTNVRTGKKVRVSRLVRMHAQNMEEVSEARAGDICAIFGVDCASGDTFVGKETRHLVMESMFVPDPVVSMAIAPKSKEADTFMKALNRFTKEDPTFHYSFDSVTKEFIVSGMGELQLEVYGQRMEREYGCEVVLGQPKVAFRETLAKTHRYWYQHKRQSGGRGQFGIVEGKVEPLPADKNTKLEFSDETTGTNIPKHFVPGVKKGFELSCEKGPLSGHRITGVKFRLIDGNHHPVDSSDYSFQLAAEGAMKELFVSAQWQIIEPVMKVEVSVPQEYQKGVVAQLQQRGALLHGSEIHDGFFVVVCEVPLSEMFGFTTELRSTTMGQGEYTMEYSRYCPAAPATADALIVAYQAELEADAAEQAPQKKKKKKN